MKVEIIAKNGFKIVDLNRRKAIREPCLNCTGWSHREVRNCIFEDCPLFLYRSGSGKQNAKARSKAIRRFCLWCTKGQHGEVSKCPSTECSLFSYRKAKIDRSAEIKSLPKKCHIGSCFEDKIETEYQIMAGAKQGEKMLPPQV